MQNIFEQIENRLQGDSRPSEFLNSLLAAGELEKWPLSLLFKLVGVPQSPQHHPEGDVWNHTCMVVDEAALKRLQSQDPRAFMWAALLHDLGKPLTTRVRKAGRVTAYDHDREGEKLAREFLEFYSDDAEFITRVTRLVRWHMQVLFVVKDLPFANIPQMLSEVDLDEVALLSLCDRLGRGSLSHELASQEVEHVRLFVEKCRQYVG